MIKFLHTSLVHIAGFDKLVAEMAPSVSAVHLVDESLLAGARRLGVEHPEVVRHVFKAMYQAASEGPAVVICTCSTIGGIAERTPTKGRYVAMRVDRPMADEAVRLGADILVVAVLESTLAPTMELIRQSAQRLGSRIELSTISLPEAWHHFERGDNAAYFDCIASKVRSAAPDHSVVVLAQASMAGAQALLNDITIPVLSSPRLGVASAVHALRARSAA